ncbi:unnamed protein product [Calicophoron daubneyi]|uniref:Uncharacterized protein n=1 Tax=Calicophoron daubneyi TaxID=300641 RepID=A0AAV2TH44_CALDB
MQWGLYAETDTKPPAETREPYTLYDTLEKPGIEGDAGRRYYGYDTGYDPRYKEDERQPYGYHAQQYSPQHELKGPHGNPSEGLGKVDPSVQLPTLPPLKSEADVLGENGESNSSTSTPTTTVEPEPELSEVPLDEFYSKIEEDPYEAQLRALAAIESCRREQSIQIQSHFEPDLEFNETEVEEDNETTSSTVTPSSVKSGKTTPSNKLIPGSLLACVYRSVQQRCHVGSATSSFTSRYACEAVCEVVRDRMPQVANKLEDCRQPLVSCTERFVVFSVATSWPVEKSEPHADNLDSYPSKPNPQSRKTQTPTAYTASGEYCQECGKKRWWLKPLVGTNLFLLVDQNLPGSTTGSCRCRCQKRFRYGARIANQIHRNRNPSDRDVTPLSQRHVES